MKKIELTKSMRLLFIVILVGGVATSTAEPGAGALGIGDPAPALQVGAWVQGEPVTEFAPDKVYLIEFWATWCGPCLESIPHLNEIAAAYDGKGLVVIGQNISEPDESRVKPFVEKMGDKMTYRVALDDKLQTEKGAMATTWLNASGASGIPLAFLVGKDGKIAWIGHPMVLERTVIEKVLAGTFDLKKAVADSQQTRGALKLGDEIELLYRAGRWDEAEAALNQSAKGISPEPSDIVLLRARIGFQRMAMQLDQQIKSKKWDAADATLEKMSQIVFPDEHREMAAEEIAKVVKKVRVMISLGRGEWKAAALHAKQLPPTEAIMVVQEAISRSNDESTLQKLREMQERLQADIRPEQKSGQ
jgi:thiol-disulfide isomerase/thioredoxin